MLVVTRKKDESFTIGAATVKVLSIQGNRVQFGIDAPADVPIRRIELPVVPAAPVETNEESPARKGRELASEPNDL